MLYRTPKLLSVILLTVIAIIIFYGSTTYIYDLPASIFCLGVAALVGAAWLIKRGVLEKATLPKTGLEIPLFLFLTAVLISIIFSPGPRIGLERMAWFIAICLLFYVLVDLFRKPEHRAYTRIAVIVTTLPLLLHALSETYMRYLIWWDQAGSRAVAPPFPVRFNSLVGHSNIFMALTNLIAPIAVVLFIRTKNRPVRVLCALWLVMFAIAIPFSSSRGGWVGIATWIVVLILLWVVDEGRWKKLLAFVRSRLAVALASGVVFTTIMIVGGAAFYNQFAGAHPSHGSGSSLNREHIWSGAIQIWQSSPWTGSGLGRLGLEYLSASKSYPSGWWPPHAHSVPLQVLSEMGLVGFIPFLILSITAIWFFVRAYRAAPTDERPWMSASFAALASFIVHGIFDDLTSPITVLLIITVHAAYLLSAGRQVRRSSHISMKWLAVPGIAILAVAIFNIWSRMPLYQAIENIETTNWRAAAQAAEESQRRDPLMPFFSAQAGIAYAMAWGESDNPMDLQRARQHLLQAADLEPNSSLLQADLAVLNWHAGRSEDALEAIRKAITLCPREPSFYINYGWFLEKLGRHEQAQTQYLFALELNPGIANHPFWSSSVDRKTAVEAIYSDILGVKLHWQNALAYLAEGDAAKAQYELAASNQYGEPAVSRAVAQIALASFEKDTDAVRKASEALANAVESEYSYESVGMGVYGMYFVRNGFMQSTVPGYIMVTEDFGQFSALKGLYEKQISEGHQSTAEITWKILQRGLYAGELVETEHPLISTLQQ